MLPNVIWDLVLSWLPLGQREYVTEQKLIHTSDLSKEQMESWQIKNDKLNDLTLLGIAVSLGSTLSLSVISHPPVRVRALFPPYMAREMLNLLLRRTLEWKSWNETFNEFSMIDSITSLESLQWHKEMRFVYCKKGVHDESESGTNHASNLSLVQVRQLTLNAINWKQLPLLKHLNETYEYIEPLFHPMLGSSDDVIIWMMNHCVDKFYAVASLIDSPMRIDKLKSRSPEVLELLHPIVQEALTMNMSMIASEVAIAIHRHKPFCLSFFDVHQGSSKIRPDHWHYVKQLHSLGVLKESKEFLFSHIWSVDEWIAYSLIHFPQDLEDIDSNILTNFIHVNGAFVKEKLMEIYKVESVICLGKHGFILTQENLIALFNRGISIRDYYAHFDSPPTTQELINAMTHGDNATTLCEIYMTTHNSFALVLDDDVIDMCIIRNKTATLVWQLSNPNYTLRYEHLLMMCNPNRRNVFANVVSLDRFLHCVTCEHYEWTIPTYKLWYPTASGLLLYQRMEKDKSDWIHCCGVMLKHFFHDLKHISELQLMFELQWRVIEFHANQ